VNRQSHELSPGSCEPWIWEKHTEAFLALLVVLHTAVIHHTSAEIPSGHNGLEILIVIKGVDMLAEIVVLKCWCGIM
jgi:hypothetical protein